MDQSPCRGIGRQKTATVIFNRECPKVVDRFRRAELMSVDTMGVLGIMDLAIEMGFTIDKRSLVKQLKAVGFRISDKLYKRMFGDLK